jgi:hypothetical protein
MLEALNAAIQAIIKLLKIKKEAKKTDLEVEKLERDKAKEESLIKIASFDDIKQFDPKTRALYEAIRLEERLNDRSIKSAAPAPASLFEIGLFLFGCLILFTGLGYLIYRLYGYFKHLLT